MVNSFGRLNRQAKRYGVSRPSRGRANAHVACPSAGSDSVEWFDAITCGTWELAGAIGANGLGE